MNAQWIDRDDYHSDLIINDIHFMSVVHDYDNDPLDPPPFSPYWLWTFNLGGGVHEVSKDYYRTRNEAKREAVIYARNWLSESVAGLDEMDKRA